MMIVDFRDGLLAGERFYWDAAGPARQLGVAALGDHLTVGGDNRIERLAIYYR